MSDLLTYAAFGLVALAVIAIVWLSLRYQSYLNETRSGSGKRPKPVWKPFWFD